VLSTDPQDRLAPSYKHSVVTFTGHFTQKLFISVVNSQPVALTHHACSPMQKPAAREVRFRFSTLLLAGISFHVVLDQGTEIPGALGAAVAAHRGWWKSHATFLSDKRHKARRVARRRINDCLPVHFRTNQPTPASLLFCFVFCCCCCGPAWVERQTHASFYRFSNPRGVNTLSIPCGSKYNNQKISPLHRTTCPPLPPKDGRFDPTSPTSIDSS
jgi:hypothetical protein